MCLLLATTSHPLYSLILLFNRDEHIDRPTERAKWHKKGDEPDILYGYDVARKTGGGSWVGISHTGRVAALTTLLSDLCEHANMSRGNCVTAFLESDLEPEEFLAHQKEETTSELNNVGGINFLCGDVKNGEFIMTSNRGKKDNHHLFHGHDTEAGMSNSLYEREWERVKLGKKLLRNIVNAHKYHVGNNSTTSLTSTFSSVTAINQSPFEKESLIHDLFEMLSRDDTNSTPKTMTINKMSSSIFFPEFVWTEKLLTGLKHHGMTQRLLDFLHTGHLRRLTKEEVKHEKKVMKKIEGTITATTKQTVVLVGKDGNVTYVERTLWEAGKRIEEDEKDLRYEFTIEELA